MLHMDFKELKICQIHNASLIHCKLEGLKNIIVSLDTGQLSNL